MAPGEPTKLSGNSALYFYQSFHRQRVFLPRNLTTALEVNGTGDGQEPRPPRRRPSTKIDDIMARIQEPHLGVSSVSRADGAVLKIEAKGLKVRNTSRPGAQLKKAKPFLCRCEFFVKYKDGSKSRDVFRTNEMCTVTPAQDGTATIDMDHPIYIKARNLYVLQKRGGVEKLELAESYLAGFLLQTNDPKSAWPPFHPSTQLPGSKMETNLVAIIRGLPEATRTRWHELHLVCSGKYIEQPSNLLIDLTLRWSNPNLCTSHPPTAPLTRPRVPTKHLTLYTLASKSASTVQTFPIAGYSCPFCNGRTFPSQPILHFHLLTSHDLFMYKLRSRKPPPTSTTCLEITLDLNPLPTLARASDSVPDHRTFMWRRPAVPFSLPAFLRSDTSWLNERKPLHPPRLPSTTSSLPPPSRLPLTNVPARPPRHKRFTAAPVTSLPAPVLLRSKSKRFVQPAEVLSESDDDISDGWLQLKTEQLLDDFEDVAASEKHFMKIWNKHLFEERPQGAVYMSQVCVRFVRENREELQADGLPVECWKWLLNLVMMGALDAECVRVCMDLLNGEKGAGEGEGEFVGERREKRRKVEEVEEWKRVCTCGGRWERNKMVRCDGTVPTHSPS